MDVQQQVKSALDHAQQLRERAKLCLSEGEALQLESQLLVQQALLLLLEQRSQSGTGSAPQA